MSAGDIIVVGRSDASPPPVLIPASLARHCRTAILPACVRAAARTPSACFISASLLFVDAAAAAAAYLSECSRHFGGKEIMAGNKKEEEAAISLSLLNWLRIYGASGRAGRFGL